MLSGQFSRTALGAAGHRAAHQILEGGRIFADPLALPILGEDAQAILAEARENPARRGLRLFVAARSRIAEEAARQAIEEGARQIVVLGAGLDTFAYRLEGKDGLRVFEVDHPATQSEKRRRLAAAGIAPPAHLTFAPCDFEHAELGDSLHAVGFNPNRRAFFLWLGVVPYLTEKAIFATLGFIAKLPGGEVVFDYANPVETIADPASRELHERLSQRVAAAGEAFRSYFETPALHEKLRALGFGEIEDLGPNRIAARYFPERAAPGRTSGGHVVRARR
jgi:methyltransferase (TIGR00027 family)